MAGLVAITPAAGFVGPVSAVIIGLVAGVLCYLAVLAKSRLGYDDALDVVGIHGIGGIWGALATGVGATMAYSFIGSLIILKIIDVTVGLRVTTEEEVQGLDITQHSEIGYSL